jgi:hypothetical protein
MKSASYTAFSTFTTAGSTILPSSAAIPSWRCDPSGPERVDLSRSAHRRLRPIPSPPKRCLRRLEAVTSAYHKMKRQRHFQRAPRRFQCLISWLVRPLRRYSSCVAQRWTWLPSRGHDLGDLTVRPGHIFRHLKNDVIRNWKGPMPTRSIGSHWRTDSVGRHQK